METLQHLLDWVLHVDKHLDALVRDYGALAYLFLFLVIFAETGLVIAPFLPGDSLLFAVGAISARPGSQLNVWALMALLMFAGGAGNTVNYWAGRLLGPRVARTGKLPLVNPRNLERTHKFFERHGAKAVILARFVPIVRTLAPFVAGAGTMSHARYQTYNWIGTMLWVGVCVLAGYFFGRREFVRDNFAYVALGIVVVSLLPVAVELIRHRRDSPRPVGGRDQGRRLARARRPHRVRLGYALPWPSRTPAGAETAMTQADISLPQAQGGLPRPRGMAKTTRRDSWWVQPLLVFLGFSAFIIYSTWAALTGANYFVHGTEYLSPFYSPLFWDAPGQHSGHAIFGPWPRWLAWLPAMLASPAIFILWIPGGFRFTCYYYRGAYYKAFWADPPACSVGEPAFRGKRYRGERFYPLIIQNIHRYFLYLALIFVVILSIDAVKAFWFHDPGGHGRFGIGVGTLVLTINPVLIGLYTFGCHSLRHLAGGRKDCISSLGARKTVYDCVSCLNRRHMTWAWISLFWVGFTDFYIRMVSMGVWHDYRII